MAGLLEALAELDEPPGHPEEHRRQRQVRHVRHSALHCGRRPGRGPVREVRGLPSTCARFEAERSRCSRSSQAWMRPADRRERGYPLDAVAAMYMRTRGFMDRPWTRIENTTATYVITRSTSACPAGRCPRSTSASAT